MESLYSSLIASEGIALLRFIYQRAKIYKLQKYHNMFFLRKILFIVIFSSLLISAVSRHKAYTFYSFSPLSQWKRLGVLFFYHT